jgi:hypothetical protein
MKKLTFFVVLFFVCLSVSLPAQTIYDAFWQAMIHEKLASVESYLKPLLKSLEGKKDPQTELTIKLIEEYRSEYEKSIRRTGENVKFDSITLGGTIDFRGENGTTYSGNIGFAFETGKILKTIAFSPSLDAGIERNDKITSYEATGGFTLDFPMINKYLAFYAKTGIGVRSPGGNDPTSFIWKFGPGIGFVISKKKCITLDLGLMYYMATNPIYYDGALQKKHDLLLNVSITYSFSAKKASSYGL